MSVIETRYRDITIEELKAVHSKMSFHPLDTDWPRMRTKPIQVQTPPIPEDEMDPAQKTCGEPWYIVVGGALTDDVVWTVCSHLAEIGD